MLTAAVIASALALAVSVAALCISWRSAHREPATDDRVARGDFEAERRRVDRLIGTLTALARRNVDAP